MAFGEDIWDGDMPVVEDASYPYNQFGQRPGAQRPGAPRPPAFDANAFQAAMGVLNSGLGLATTIAAGVAGGAAPSQPQAAAPQPQAAAPQPRVAPQRPPQIVYAQPPQTVQPSPPSNPSAPAKLDPTLLAVGGLAVAGILVAVLAGGRRR